MTAKPQELFCSFCGEPEHAVRKLISGPSVCICDGCFGYGLDVLFAEGLLTTDTRVRLLTLMFEVAVFSKKPYPTEQMFGEYWELFESARRNHQHELDKLGERADEVLKTIFEHTPLVVDLNAAKQREDMTPPGQSSRPGARRGSQDNRPM